MPGSGLIVEARRRVGEARQRVGPRRLYLAAGLAVVLAILLAAAYSQRDLIRRTVAERMDLEVKHGLISAYGMLLSRPHNTADLVPIANADVKPYAVNVFLEQEVEEVKVRRSLQMIRDAGFAWIKQQMVWGEIEVPAKGRYGEDGETWAKYDRIVDLAREYDLGVIFRIDTSPWWARPGSEKLETPPLRFSDYGDFVHAVVSRYRGRVRYYQIWNEPNLAFEWGGARPDPEQYTRLLQTAYVRAKEADPDAVILSAALAPTIEESDVGLNDLKYLQAMYDAGARGYFDVLGANAYGLRGGPDEWRLDMDRDVNFARPVLLRELMVENGDAGKPIWAAEVGWNALPPNFGEVPRYGVVNRQQQGDYTARAFRRAQEEWPWMGVLAIWHFRMVSVKDLNQQQYYFNLVDDGFNPYPVYDAMKALATSQPVTGRGYHQESYWALQFSPGWHEARDPRASLGGYSATDNPAERLTFQFAGTSLDLVVPRGPNLGRLVVSIDDWPYAATELPSDGGRTYVDLYAPTDEWQVRVPVARGLPEGVHRVVIGPAGTANPLSQGSRVAVDAVVVDGPWPPDRLRARAAALGLAVIGVGMTMVRTARGPSGGGGAAG